MAAKWDPKTWTIASKNHPHLHQDNRPKMAVPLNLIIPKSKTKIIYLLSIIWFVKTLNKYKKNKPINQIKPTKMMNTMKKSTTMKRTRTINNKLNKLMNLKNQN